MFKISKLTGRPKEGGAGHHHSSHPPNHLLANLAPCCMQYTQYARDSSSRPEQWQRRRRTHDEPNPRVAAAAAPLVARRRMACPAWHHGCHGGNMQTRLLAACLQICMHLSQLTRLLLARSFGLDMSCPSFRPRSATESSTWLATQLALAGIIAWALTPKSVSRCCLLGRVRGSKMCRGNQLTPCLTQRRESLTKQKRDGMASSPRRPGNFLAGSAGPMMGRTDNWMDGAPWTMDKKSVPSILGCPC